MLKFLLDPANAITTCGLTFAVIGLYEVLGGHFELGIAAVIWSLLADHLDGIVAARTRNRDPDKGKIGKQLDSFTDLVSDAVFPAMLVLELNHGSPVSLVIAVILLVAGALRLSYFNSFGLSDGRFVGVPLSYDIPLLAVLHVSTIRVPRASGAVLVGIVIFSVGASALLASRGFI